MKTQLQFLFRWSREILTNRSDKPREKTRKNFVTLLLNE